MLGMNLCHENSRDTQQVFTLLFLLWTFQRCLHSIALAFFLFLHPQLVSLKGATNFLTFSTDLHLDEWTLLYTYQVSDYANLYHLVVPAFNTLTFPPTPLGSYYDPTAPPPTTTTSGGTTTTASATEATTDDEQSSTGNALQVSLTIALLVQFLLYLVRI